METDTKRRASTADQEEITYGKAFGSIAGALGVLAIVVCCWVQWDLVFSLLALTGAVSGWLTGVLIAPLSPTEEQRFSVFMKVISGFITGYLLSKLDPLITHLLTINDQGVAPIAETEVAVRFLITLSSFGVMLLLVFNFRAYWSADPSVAGNTDTQDGNQEPR